MSLFLINGDINQSSPFLFLASIIFLPFISNFFSSNFNNIFNYEVNTSGWKSKIIIFLYSFLLLESNTSFEIITTSLMVIKVYLAILLFSITLVMIIKLIADIILFLTLKHPKIKKKNEDSIKYNLMIEKQKEKIKNDEVAMRELINIDLKDDNNINKEFKSIIEEFKKEKVQDKNQLELMIDLKFSNQEIENT